MCPGVINCYNDRHMTIFTSEKQYYVLFNDRMFIADDTMLHDTYRTAIDAASVSSLSDSCINIDIQYKSGNTIRTKFILLQPGTTPEPVTTPESVTQPPSYEPVSDLKCISAALSAQFMFQIEEEKYYAVLTGFQKVDLYKLEYINERQLKIINNPKVSFYKYANRNEIEASVEEDGCRSHTTIKLHPNVDNEKRMRIRRDAFKYLSDLPLE